MLQKLSVHEFLAQLAQKGAPGSGSAAALTGATGVSLLEMMVALCPVAPEREATAARLIALRAHLEVLLEQDVEVLTKALPALTEIGPDGNSGEWNMILLQAAKTPLAIAADCLAALETAKALKRFAPPNLVCDIKVAAMHCHTGLQSGLLLAELNASLLRDDEQLGRQTQREINALLEKTERLMDVLLA